MDGVNYYQLFSLNPTATPDELKSQYRRLSLQYHPDRGGTTEQMSRLNEAYRVLSNPLLRREYDQKRVTQELVTDNNYHYTRPQSRPTATAATPQKSHFWQWFTALAILGLALITYDVMSTWVLPRYVHESSASASSENLTPSGDLTDEAASALSEFQSAQFNDTRTQPALAPSRIAPMTPAPMTTPTPQTNSSDQSTSTPSTWRERMRSRADN